MFICIGGVNKHGYGLKEILSIDIETRQWQELSTKGEHPGYLNSSAMCLVAYTERTSLNLKYLSEIHWDYVT